MYVVLVTQCIKTFYRGLVILHLVSRFVLLQIVWGLNRNFIVIIFGLFLIPQFRLDRFVSHVIHIFRMDMVVSLVLFSSVWPELCPKFCLSWIVQTTQCYVPCAAYLWSLNLDWIDFLPICFFIYFLYI